ncbi:MAG: GGDEF domain-containing response regulator [Syntrophomonas sp.]
MSKTLKILVIEHIEHDQLLLKQAFSVAIGINCELVIAEKFAKAIELLESNDVDLILFDLMLPDLNGNRNIENILGKYSELPTIVLSSLADEEMALDAVKKGAQDYLIKDEINSYPLKQVIKCSIERNLLRVKMARLSLTDDLTKLYNRRGFFSMTQQQLELARRLEKNIGIFFIDIDGMKEINDYFGHHQGDQALIDTSQILKDACRVTDVIGRIGGDEFGISLIQGMSCIKNIETRIRKRIELHNKASLRKYKLSISIGNYCINAQNCVDIENSLAEADKMMYIEKSEKKRVNPEKRNFA